ncbi:MAG: TRAP transporter small permease subunit [Burkholderiales bacterium]
MTRLIGYVDALSVWVGHATAWLIALLTAVIAFEVFSRYVLGRPHDWAFDASYMLYGTLFMLAGAYALAKNAHVRGDLLYGSLTPRQQAGLDLALYVLFFLPGVAALAFAGYTFASDSWAIHEGSPLTPDGLVVYPFKSVIPLAGVLLLLQGIAEILRCLACLASGAWPARAPDVQEVDLDELQQRTRSEREVEG